MSRGAATACVDMVYTRVDDTAGFEAWITESVLETSKRTSDAVAAWAAPSTAPMAAKAKRKLPGSRRFGLLALVSVLIRRRKGVTMEPR